MGGVKTESRALTTFTVHEIYSDRGRTIVLALTLDVYNVFHKQA